MAGLEASDATPEAASCDPKDVYVTLMVAGDRTGALASLKALREQGWTPQRLYLEVLQPALHEVGSRWEMNRLTVSEEHLCTATTLLALTALVEPARVLRAGRPILIATCPGDTHVVGARMVADFLTMAGFDARFFGCPVDAAALVAAVHETDAWLVGLSATRKGVLGDLRATVAALRAGCGASILVGGQAFADTQHPAALVGANGDAKDAGEALAWVERHAEGAA